MSSACCLSNRTTLHLGICLTIATLCSTTSTSQAVENEQQLLGASKRTPNIVLIFADDQGYGDLGCYGATEFETPNLDQMAKEGAKFTHFYVAQSVCGASRAALLTGCYSNRIGISGAPSHATKWGISADEVTLGELAQQCGYRTAIFGKWHLGHHRPFLPLQNGFDEYYGLPYSNDMWPHHPTSNAFPKLPMYLQNTVIDDEVTAEEQTQLTKSYTDLAVDFIERNQERPFLLYVAHSMPHVPLFCDEAFSGSSKQGAYGDVIQEIDHGVGRILDKLEECGLNENTLVIYTSDNGPWLSYGNHAGSTGGLREGKGTAWEGGVREPCIMKWPGVIPADTTCDQVAATIDIFPTVAELLQADLPSHAIDGKSITALLKNPEEAKSPHDAFFYYYGNGLRAVRSGPWKLVFPHKYRSLKGQAGKDGYPGPYVQVECGLELYHLIDDPNETTDVGAEHPEVVKRLQAFGDQIREELGDDLTGKKGTGHRPHGTIQQ